MDFPKHISNSGCCSWYFTQSDSKTGKVDWVTASAKTRKKNRRDRTAATSRKIQSCCSKFGKLRTQRQKAKLTQRSLTSVIETPKQHPSSSQSHHLKQIHIVNAYKKKLPYFMNPATKGKSYYLYAFQRPNMSQDDRYEEPSFNWKPSPYDSATPSFSPCSFPVNAFNGDLSLSLYFLLVPVALPHSTLFSFLSPLTSPLFPAETFLPLVLS